MRGSSPTQRTLPCKAILKLFIASSPLREIGRDINREFCFVMRVFSGIATVGGLAMILDYK
jgi:hypothetical protein